MATRAAHEHLESAQQALGDAMRAWAEERDAMHETILELRRALAALSEGQENES